MEPQALIVLVLAVFVLAGFVTERLSPDVVALSAMAVLLLAGILTTEEVLHVFANSGPITVGAMFVISAALERTGFVDTLGHLVMRAAKLSPAGAVVGVIGTGMGLSAFINNTPVVVILTPVVFSLSHAIGVLPSRLLIPLSYGAIFGGTCTLVGTSTNLLVDGVAADHGMTPFGMFEISPFGLVLGAVGAAYLLTAYRWLLPDRADVTTLLSQPGRRQFLAELLVSRDSPFIGRTLAEAGLGQHYGARVIDVLRGTESLREGLREVRLAGGDRLVIRTNVGEALRLRETGMFGEMEPLATQRVALLEGIVGTGSHFIGRPVGELNLRRLYGVYILAVHRKGATLGRSFKGLRLRFGDTLLLEGPVEGLQELFERGDLINLTEPSERPFRRHKGPIALAAVAFVMLLAALNVMPIVALALIAAVAVVAFGCLSADEAYSAIRWPILMLIFGMLALGSAVEKTGLDALIVAGLLNGLGQLGPLWVMSLLYLTSSVMTEIISNNAAAILLTPIAIAVAEGMGADPRPFVVAVMFAASASFATPIGYQTNTFVYGVGGYRFVDFLKVGLPLNLLFWLVATVMIPVFWPFLP